MEWWKYLIILILIFSLIALIDIEKKEVVTKHKFNSHWNYIESVDNNKNCICSDCVNKDLDIWLILDAECNKGICACIEEKNRLVID